MASLLLAQQRFRTQQGCVAQAHGTNNNTHNQAEYGPALGTDPEAIAAACERFITRSVHGTRPRDEWRADVGARCVAAAPSACLRRMHPGNALRPAMRVLLFLRPAEPM